MEKRLAKQIAEHWNSNFADSTDDTKTVAVAEEGNVYIRPTATNDGVCFYHNEEFADVMRAFKVSGLVCISEGVCVARLF